MAVPYILKKDSKVYLHIDGITPYAIKLLASDFSYSRQLNKVSYGGGTLHSPNLIRNRISTSQSDVTISLTLNLTAETICARALAAMFNFEFDDLSSYADVQLGDTPSIKGEYPVNLYIDSTDTNYTKLGNIVGQSISLSGGSGNVVTAEIKLKATTLEQNVVFPNVSVNTEQNYSKLMTTAGTLIVEKDDIPIPKLNTADFSFTRNVGFLNDNSVHVAMSPLLYSPSRPTVQSVTIGGKYVSYAEELIYDDDYGNVTINFNPGLQVMLSDCHCISATRPGDIYQKEVDYQSQNGATNILRIYAL